MWKVCVVFFGVLWSRIECLKTFPSLRSGRRPFAECRPPAPTSNSVSDMLFSCDFPLSAAAATGCVAAGWVCLGGRLCFAFLMMIFQLATSMFAFRQRLWQYIQASSIAGAIPIALVLGLLYAFIGYMKIFSTLHQFLLAPPQPCSATIVSRRSYEVFFLVFSFLSVVGGQGSGYMFP